MVDSTSLEVKATVRQRSRFLLQIDILNTVKIYYSLVEEGRASPWVCGQSR